MNSVIVLINKVHAENLNGTLYRGVSHTIRMWYAAVLIG